MKIDDVIQQPGHLEWMQQSSILRSGHTSVVGSIVKYDPGKRTVDVQPMVRGKTKENPPLLMDVPVWFPGSFTYDVNVGDECLVVFVDNCIDAWWQSGTVSSPITARAHDMSDGIAIVGLRSLPNVTEGTNLNDILKPFTGATSLTDGEMGLVPKPTIADVDKYLKGDGTWHTVEGGGGGDEGVKVYTVEVTVTNPAGAFSVDVTDDVITDDMKAIELEVNRPYVFGDVVIVTPHDGYFNISCANVSGTDTIKVSFLKVAEDPTHITSTEFDILNNRISVIENTEALYSVTIQTTDWSASPYTYTWTNSDVTANCSVEIGFLDGAEDCDIDFLEWEKSTGSITFSVETLPSVALPIVIKLTNARAKYVEDLTADMVATDAVSGESNVQDALEVLSARTDEVEHTLTIEPSDWAVSEPYTYTWTDADVTANCKVEIEFLNGAELCDVSFLSWEKVTGGIEFEVSAIPTADLPLLITLRNLT